MVKQMYITVNDITLHYECLGSGKEILFIPGNGTSYKYMVRLAKMIAKDYKVYLIDRRGQGKSSKKCKIDYELELKDIYEFIQALNLDKPYILAHSGGAAIAMMFVLKYSDKVEKLILCSGTTNVHGTSAKYIKRWKLYSKIGLINSRLLNMVLNQKDITKDILKITIDTLVLAGEKDIILKEHTHTIASKIPNCKLKIYDNQNHTSYITNATCYKDIMNFLKE